MWNKLDGKAYLDLSFVLANRPDACLVDNMLFLGDSGSSLFYLSLHVLFPLPLGLFLQLRLHANLDDHVNLALLHLLLDLCLVLVILQTPNAVLEHLQLELSLSLLLETLKHHCAFIHETASRSDVNGLRAI